MLAIPTRRLALVLASGLLILLTGAGVRAQDGGSFFEQLFGTPTRPAAPVQPRYDRQGLFDYGARQSQRRVRAERRFSYAKPSEARHQQRPKTRYAALPKAEAIKVDPDKITGKQPVDQKAILDNPTKAILSDKTLRPGDIVMLPGGPKVFVGGGDKRHRMSDFEDVKQSRKVDKKTRQQLLAMMVPVGAMPADQARKVMAQTLAKKRKLAHPDEIAAVEASNDVKNDVKAEPSSPRVINPWKPAQ